MNAHQQSSLVLKNKDIGRIFLIFLAVFLASLWGFNEAKKRERDVQRNSDISEIAKALEAYRVDYGFYPASSPEGEIIACSDGEKVQVLTDEKGLPVIQEGFKKPKVTNLVPCRWGQDKLQDVSDPNYPPYLELLPADPQTEKGAKYFYILKGDQYSVYTGYETKKMPDYSRAVLSLKLKCGRRFCNAGRTNGVLVLE